MCVTAWFVSDSSFIVYSLADTLIEPVGTDPLSLASIVLGRVVVGCESD